MLTDAINQSFTSDAIEREYDIYSAIKAINTLLDAHCEKLTPALKMTLEYSLIKLKETMQCQ